jgi:hypothetical protein
VTAAWNDDFVDMLRALVDAGVEFLVVGAHALAVHGIPRATLDLDVWVRPSRDNAPRVIEALRAFGAPLAAHGIVSADFEEGGTVYQLGLPPNRIDLLTSISGVDFAEAWPSRVEVEVEGIRVPFIGARAQLTNKLAAGRDKDLVDAKLLKTKG